MNSAAFTKLGDGLSGISTINDIEEQLKMVSTLARVIISNQNMRRWPFILI